VNKPAAGVSERRRAPRAREQALRRLLAQELIEVCMATLKTYDLDSATLIPMATRAARRTSGKITLATAVLDEAQRLSEATNKWVEDPAYRDATGRPAVLAVRDGTGRNFAMLAREFFPGWKVAEVVTLGCKANVLERIGRHKVALLDRAVLFTGKPLSILAYSIRTLRRFLGTAEFNRRAKAAALEGWPDRTSFVDIPEDDFPEFVRVFRPQISDLMERSNRWLFQRSQVSASRRRKKRIAGLQAFLFRE
jgi:hypothetical protein